MTRKQLAPLWLLTIGLLTGCTFITQIFVPAPRVVQQLYVSNVGSATLPGGGANPCTSSSTPCHMVRAKAVAACGDTINMLDGVYTGANYVFDTVGGAAPANPNCSSGNEITVRAINDGRVTIDAGGTTPALAIYNMSYWKFIGFDATNGRDQYFGTAYLENSNNITIQRVCISNVKFVPPYLVGPFPDERPDAHGRWNEHTFAIVNSGNNLFEDLCVFGTGRVNINEREAGSANNKYRRVWIRWEGWLMWGGDALSTGNPHPGGPSGGADCGGPPLQTGYAADQSSLFENVITVWSTEQIKAAGAAFSECNTATAPPPAGGYISQLIRDWPQPGAPGYRFRGYIAYAYTNLAWPPFGPGSPATESPIWFNQGGSDKYSNGPKIDVVDMFMDGLTPSSGISANYPVARFTCAFGVTCVNEKLDRMTTLKGASQPSNWYDWNGSGWGQFTNINECTSLAACPNFYTGSSPGTGARNCFEYTNGVLGSTAATQGLWPWRMDTGGMGTYPSRIKSALAYERAAGRGGTALAGAAGSGYEAATVTSEIASRYGPIPAGCSRTTATFVPDFPTVTDFPSTPILDQFTRADGGIGANYTTLSGLGLNVSSTRAVPVSGPSRVLWNPDAFAGTHEVYKTMTTAPVDGTSALLLLFGANSLANVGYQVIVDRVAGANDKLSIYKLLTGTTILGPIDLGTDVQSGDLFGVRVNATQTISLYWRYNGTTFRVGTVIDTDLPSANVRIGFGVVDGEADDDFGGGACCGGATPSPGTIGRFGSRFPTQ